LTLKGICAEGSLKTFVAATLELSLIVDISELIKPNEQQNFPKHWKAEHVFGWMNHFLRCSKDYEIRAFSIATIIIISNLTLNWSVFEYEFSNCKFLVTLSIINFW
jgi:hypothetical protein